jgi:DNA-binding MarR family transcriptional regulator
MRVGSKSKSKDALAAEVWRLLAEFTWTLLSRGGAFSELKRLGLTPGHLKVLVSLQPDSSLSMGAIADVCSCDPSVATWLVDRLEEQSLVERKMSKTDRRVKDVHLTAKGVEARTLILDRLFEPPQEVLKLDRETLSSLRDGLTKLRESSPGPFHGHWQT